MKSTTAKFLGLISALIVYGAILFLLFAALPLSLRAQTNAGETGASNGVATTNEVMATTNVPVSGVPATNKESSSDESTPVRIDGTGVHIGGESPVDIRMPGSSKSSLPAVLALLVPFAPFVMIVAIIAIVFYFNHRRNNLVHETLRAMIEKGMPVTPELIASMKNKGNKVSVEGKLQDRGTGRLLVGLILVGVGTGVVAMAGKPGLIVLFIGVAFLIVWLVERQKNGDVQHNLSITKQGIQITEKKQNSDDVQPPKL